MFIDWLFSNSSQLSEHYRTHPSFSVSKQLFDAYRQNSGTEFDLIDQYARILKLEGWFTLRVEFTVEEDTPSGPTNPGLLKKKESATVMFCLSALNRFEKMEQKKIHEIVSEICLLGQTGIDYTTPDARYSLKSLPAEQFSGLQLLTLMYVGFKKIDPGLDTGLDFAEAYEMAVKLL